MRKQEFKKLIKNLPWGYGKETLFNSAVLIPFVKIEGEYFILFQKRAKHIRQGRYLFL